MRGADVLPTAVAEATPDAVVTLDADRRVTQVNAAGAVLLGRPPHKLVGTEFEDVVPRSERAMLAAYTHRAFQGLPQRFELTLLSADDHERRVAIAAAVQREPNGSTALVMSIRDVTADQTAYESLVRSEARYRHLFEGASDAIMTLDAFGRFTTVNDAGEQISGYRREELIGRFFGPLLPLEELPKAVSQFRRALSGQPGQFDTVIFTKSGQRRYITVTYSCPQKSHEVLCLIRDATAEKQLQQQLIQSEKMAAIGQLVSGVAHELNNPLASISAFAQLLLADRNLAGDHRHSAEVIGAEARRAARIVSNLLTFARQHKAEKVAVDINRMLDDTLELRSYELNVRGIRIERDYDVGGPETMADVHQLQQVILNIVTNAEQAMLQTDAPHHRLTVRSRRENGTVRIEVEDTGPGIPADSLERIFNPFYTTKPVGNGTGLGLSISDGIIREHGGRIWAENVPGAGARFCVELPYIAPVRAEPIDQAAEAASPIPGLRVLVADDEAPIRTALDRFLSSAGHDVVTTASGLEAMRRAAEERFDVILLDIRMPDRSGKQIFERWREQRPDLASRVIFLTGDTVSADLRAFLDGSERPYLSKPFEFEAILAALPQEPERLEHARAS